MATGFLGKLPAQGDFVARGLPTGAQGALDRWLTRWLAPHAEMAGLWPERGLRAAVETQAGAVALLVLPSRDRVGRTFPLAAVAPLGGAGQAGVDAWAEAALFPLDAAAAGEADAAMLAEALAAVADPAGGTPLAPPLLWADGGAPAAPEVALPGLLGGRRVSSA